MFDARLACRYQIGAGATTSLSSAAVDTKSLLYTEGGEVRRLEVYLTTATVSTGNIVVKFYYRPTKGSSSAQVTLGTLTIPTAIAADKVYYKDITPYLLPSQSEVAFEVTTAAAGGGAAGACIWDVIVNYSAETEANVSKMVASA